MSVITKDFARFPFDGDIKNVLNSLGFNSVYDILSLESTRFYQQYDLLLNGNAVAIYQQAKDFVTLADQQLRRSDDAPQMSASAALLPLSDTSTAMTPVFATDAGGGSASEGQQHTLVPAQKAQLARYQPPLYERLFSDDQTRFAPPGSLQSLDSPVSYLMHLLTLLYHMRHQGNSALQDLLARRPDLGTLLLNEDAFKRALPTSMLAGEILQNALTALTKESDIDRWLAFQPYPLSLPFDVARARIDLVLGDASLTLGDAWSTLSADYRSYSDKSAPALAWSGANAGLQHLLTQPLSSTAQPCPPFFLLIDETGQPTGEHSLALGQLWPGREIKALEVKAPPEILCSTSSSPKKSIKLTLVFEAHSDDTASLRSVKIDDRTIPEDSELYRGTVTLTVAAKRKSDGEQLEERQIQVGLLVGKNLSSRQATLAVFTAEREKLSQVLDPAISSAVAAHMAVPVDMLCQAAGINRQQLQEAFALGDYAPTLSPWIKWDSTHSPVNGGIYGARFLWGTAACLAGDEPGGIKNDELNTTPFQLDRLQKLIRLQQVSGLPYDQLDNLLQNAIDAQKDAQDISLRALGVLGIYQRYVRAYKLDAEQVAALFGLMPYCSRAGKKSLLDRLLAVGSHLNTGDSNAGKFTLTGQGWFKNEELTLLAAAFDTTVDTLNLLRKTYETEGNYIVKCSLEGITALYRPVLLAKSFSLSVETLLLLIELISGKASLKLLAQPEIAQAATTDGTTHDSIDLLITLDEAVRWGQRQARDLNVLMAPLRDNAEKTWTFSEAFIALWYASYLREKEQRDKALLEEEQRKKSRGEAGLSEGDLNKKLNEPVKMPKPGELINKLKNSKNEQEKPEANGAGQDLAPLVTLLSQQLHLEPGVAWSLLFNYAGVLDPLADKITNFLDAMAAEPDSLKNALIILKNMISQQDDPNNLIPTLKPLLLAASVFSDAHLDEVALTPWRNGKLAPITSLPLWQQMLWLHDFNDLAQGDERVRPVLLSEAENWKERLATGYETDVKTVEDIVGKDYHLPAHHQLQRMAEFSHASGWGVTDISWLIAQKDINQTNWRDYFAFSLRSGAEGEADASTLTARLGEKRNSALLAAYKSQCRSLTIADEGKYWESAWEEHEPTTADVADTLLIDPEITAKVPTTRIGEATASVQAYIQYIADGRDPQWHMNEGELKNWHENDRYYAIWAANQQLRWHPDQYINPVSRLKKTPPFREFENQLSQARLDKDSINDALSGYLTLFEEVVNLSTIGAYQDGMSSTQSTIYFLGRSPHAPFSYYYRTWGKDSSGLRLWSSWQKINLPTTQNVLTQAPPGAEWNNYRKQQQDRDWMPVQARLLIFAGRVSFIWVETRILTESVQVNDAASDGNESKDNNPSASTVVEKHTPAVAEKRPAVAEKRYQHVISLVYQRINGVWSTPIELYKSQPCLPGMPVPVTEPGTSVFHTEPGASYIDPLPHLAAFVLPGEVAEGSLSSIKDESRPYYNNGIAVTSDLLAVALYSTYSDPKQENASSKLWLFDEDLVELLPVARWEKLKEQALYEGMDIDKAIKDNPDNPLLKTINDLVNNSYLYTPAQVAQSKDKSKKPSDPEYAKIYFTRVLTPCIPENWLFNQRRLESRSEPVFGTQLNLTLSVNSQTSGQAGLDSYLTVSVLKLTPEQAKNVPPDKKLVHFLCVKGKTVRQVLTSAESRLTLSTFYPAATLDTGEARHGVVLVAKAASDIVSMQPSSDAWIESGQLAVLHLPLTTLAAEIRQNVQGAQYLYLNDLDQPDTLHSSGHTIHGRVDPDIHQTTTTVVDVYNTLVTGAENPAGIAVSTLEHQSDWMPLTFVNGGGGAGLSQWTFDIPKKRLAVWLVTKVDSESIRNALKKTTAMPDGVTAWQTDNDKLVQRAALSAIDVAKPIYLFTQINITRNEQSFSQTCQIAALAQKPVFTPVTFKFYPVSPAQQDKPLITLENSGLRIISQQELVEELTPKELEKTTLFTKADWGWISPTFLTKSQPYQLNRTWRLQSPACHYLLLKVATSAFASAEGFSIRVQTMLNTQQTAACKVVGIDKDGKATDINLVENKEYITVQSQNQSNMLTLVKGEKLDTWLKKYSYLFFALPWTADAMADVASYGLRFQLDGLKNTPLYGYIPCEIPDLADAVITSSCTPGHAAVGDTVTIRADIKLGPNMDQAVNITVALNAAYQWVSGVATSTGAQIKNDGTLSLTLLPGQRTASLTLPARVLNATGNVLPLATLTLADSYSARRVMLEQPVIEREHAAQIEWDWYFGPNTDQLTRSSALRSVSVSQLSSALVFNTLRIAPSSADTAVSAMLNLPEKITLAEEAVKNLELLKTAKEKEKTAKEKEKKATAEEDEWLAGIALVTAFLKAEGAPKTGLLKLLDNEKLSQPVILPLPLQPLPADTGKDGTGIDSLTAQVEYGPAQGDVWWKRSYPISPATKGALAVSASSQQPMMSSDAKNEISCSFGEEVKLTLLIEAKDNATVSEVLLALPKRLSWQNGAILGKRLSPVSEAVSLKATVLNESQISIPLALNLEKGVRYQLDVTVVAIPQTGNKTDSGQAVFSVKTGSDTLVANAIKMGELYLPGAASVVSVYEDGTVIPAGTPLAIGSRFNYRISFALDADTLRKIMGGEEVTDPVPGPQLRFELPGKYGDSGELEVAEGIGKELPTDLPVLSKEQAEALKPGSSQSPFNFGLHVVGERKVSAQTVINPQSGISGEFQVPVIVKQEGTLIPTLSVRASNNSLGDQPWKVLYAPTYQPLALSAYDSGRLPFTDLQFRRSGREGFDLPLPENTPSVLADKHDERLPAATRYVRLNNQFGQALVRTARYNPLAVLRAAMQDHPLPPLVPGEDPQPLVQDIANQLYFWELFYHVPALVAFKLNQDGRYEEAQEWLHYLFHPTFARKDQQPELSWRCRLLTTSYSYVSLDQATGPVDPDVIASVRPEFYQRATFFAYVKNLLDSGDSYYRSQSRDGFNKAWQCYLKVAHLLGSGEQNSQIAPWKPLTIATAINTLVSSGTPDRLFALPRSHTYQNLVDKLQQRLFNMRNGLTLDGSPLSLPLYDPPLDPAQLLAARSQGSIASIRALAMRQNTLLPLFRYSTLYARANAAVDTLIQFGNSLLSNLSVQKDMEYQSLLINQQKEMSDFVTGQQQLALQVNQQARQSLIIARDAAEQKLRDLDSQIERDISDQESTALSLRVSASAMGVSSSAMRATGAALDLAPNIFGFADGGMHWGAIPQAVGEGMMAIASGLDGSALQIETREMYRRRREEWLQQRADTEASLRQLEVQLEVDTRQQENLERQLTQSRAQIRQFEQQLSFISTRFTNQLLYQWLVGQLSSLYYQVYDIAAGLCQQTLTAWQYEVGNYSETGAQFFKNSGWGDAQRGLLSGEHLRLGLLQLDKAYLSQTERMLEIRHTVSLKSLWLNQTSGPVQEAAEKVAAKLKDDQQKDANQKAAAIKAAREQAVEKLWQEAVLSGKAEQVITIPVTEDLLAQRYPGHYQRQVLDVSVTLPCLIGPYEEVCAMLTQKESFFAIDPQVTYREMKAGKAIANKILSNHRPQQAIALSSGLEDNGVVLNFSDDKYRPFEGNGVVGTWCLTIPNSQGELQKRMLASLNDIILTFRYRAKDGGPARAEKVLGEMKGK